MEHIYVNLSTIADVKDFVEEVNRLDCKCVLKTGIYIIDAASIMGIFSLDLSKAIKFEFPNEYLATVQDKFYRFQVVGE